MKRFTKKTWLSIACVTLALVMAIGGVFAYLMDSSDEVRNEFNKNSVDVGLEESPNEYDIVPGTEQTKDPTVTYDTTLPAYVFVEVIDETDGLVEWTIDNAWTPLPDQPGVFFQRVEKGEGRLPVLKDNKVKYSAAITNEQMENADDELALTFKSHIIQSAPFANANEAWDQILADAAAEDELPDASLTELDVDEIPAVTDQDNGWTGPLDVAVNFAANDEPADLEGKDYANWTVDFVLSFNKPVNGADIHLFGNYGTYGWLGDDLAAGGVDALDAYEEFNVMGDWFLPAIGMGNGRISYEEVVNSIQSFDCGVAVEDPEVKDGLVATLKLVMTDGEGGVHEICTQVIPLS